MKYNVNKIEINNKGVPLHVHSVHEIIFYYEGEGNITVSGKEYKVKRGDIVIIPSGTYHCTLPTDMLKGIYLNGELSQLFNLSSPLFIKDNQAEEGCKLIQIIYDNRFGNKEYLTVLINAYLQYILQSVTFENDLNLAVKNIIKSITERCFEADLSISKILNESGYSEDYVRASFKKIVGKTSTQYKKSMEAILYGNEKGK